MTVVRRPAKQQEVRTRGRRAPLAERFPRGLKVEVVHDYHDERFRGRFGRVVSVHEDRDESYPRGRVAVLLVWQELEAKLFARPKPPNPIHFSPFHLEKR